MDGITVDHELRPLPEEPTLGAVAALYSTQTPGDPLLIRLNGKVINTILDQDWESVPVENGDEIGIFALVIGG